MEKITHYYVENPTVFDQLMKPVETLIKEQSEKLTSHHNEKFFFPDFFRLLIYYFVSGTQSIGLLINALKNTHYLRNSSYAEFRSTFNDAFERFSSDLFKTIFISLLSSLSLKAIPEIESLGVIYCVDGSLFPTMSSMLWAEYKKNSKAIRLHLCHELNRMIPVEIIVGSGNSSEREALRKMLANDITSDFGRNQFFLKPNCASLSKPAWRLRLRDACYME